MKDFSLGHRIRELRLKKGMKQGDLAKGLCTPSMISQIESDRARPSYKVLSVIAGRLEVSLEQLLSAVDLDMEIESLYKMAQAMIASGEFKLAIPLLVQLTERTTFRVPQADLRLLLGVCYVNTKEFSKAERTLEGVYRAAGERQNHHLAAQALHQMGRLHLCTKKHHLAVFQLEKALDQVNKCEVTDPVLMSKIWSDLGRSQLRLGQVTKAVESFEQSAVLLEGMQNFRDLAELYLQMGKVYRTADNHEKAAEYADRATALYKGLDHVTIKVRIDCEAALIRCANGDVDPALETLRRSIAQFLELQEKGFAGEAYLELAKLHVQRGEITEAAESVDQARILLPETNLYRGRVCYLRAQLAVKSGKTEEAIRCYEKASGFLKAADAFREWEDVTGELAELYLNAGDEKHAYQLMHEGYLAAHQKMMTRGIYL